VTRSQEVQIKGTPEGLVILLNPTADFERLKHSLSQQLERARGFFAGARFTFYHGPQKLPAEKTEELLRLAAQYGLVYTEKISFSTVPQRTGRKQLTGPETAISPPPKTYEPSVSEPERETLPPGAEAALLIRNSLRSGQSVTTEKHLVITGDVHPGALVTAVGNIIVLGSLLGAAAAGIGGKKSAVIIARKLAPVAVSIAGVAGAPPAKPLTNGKAMLKDNNVIYTAIL